MNWNLITKYLSGQTDPDEDETVEEWIKGNPVNKVYYESLLRVWSVVPPVDIDTTWLVFKREQFSENEYPSEKLDD